MAAPANPIRLTVWHEYRHEKKSEAVRKLYPDGMHAVIASAITEHLGAEGVQVRTATLDEPEHGLTDEVLNNTDVMTWWGHMLHNQVQDSVVDLVQKYVLNGMGLVVLHSGHESKVFKRLMGTTCDLKWREAAETERIWVSDPGHPIAAGLGDYIEIPQEEMYGEPFYIPMPDDQIFISWFKGGEVFRSGCTWHRGRGKIFYFRPGHETYPTYHNPQVMHVIANGIQWVAPNEGATISGRHHINPIEPLPKKD
jgi:trehalose utilization protein